jgi:hypothetical protein
MNDDEFFAQVRDPQKSNSKHIRRSKKESRTSIKEERLSIKIKQHYIVEFNQNLGAKGAGAGAAIAAQPDIDPTTVSKPEENEPLKKKEDEIKKIDIT